MTRDPYSTSLKPCGPVQPRKGFLGEGREDFVVTVPSVKDEFLAASDTGLVVADWPPLPIMSRTVIESFHLGWWPSMTTRQRGGPSLSGWAVEPGAFDEEVG